MVLGVGTEVIGERVDPRGEEGDLHFGGPGVGLVRSLLGDDRLLVKTHAACILLALAWERSPPARNCR